MTFELTPDTLGAIVGGMLTVFFTYFPDVRTRFAAKSSTFKSLVILGLLVIAALVIYSGNCAFGLWTVAGLVCGKSGLVQTGAILWAAIAANVTAYVILPQPEDVQRQKAIIKAAAADRATAAARKVR